MNKNKSRIIKKIFKEIIKIIKKIKNKLNLMIIKKMNNKHQKKFKKNKAQMKKICQINNHKITIKLNNKINHFRNKIK